MTSILTKLPAMLALWLFALAVVGCGGSGNAGGGSTSDSAPVRTTIQWAERSRAVSGPSAALSAAIRIVRGGVQNQDVTYTVNRPASPTSVAQTYTSPQPVRFGTRTVIVTFFALANGTGDVVATATADVTINATNTETGAIQTVSEIVSVTLAADQQVQIGETKEITLTARDGEGQIVAVTEGSATFEIVNGSQALRIENGRAVGVSRGTAQVRATLNGVQSQTVSIQVIDPLAEEKILFLDGKRIVMMNPDNTGRTTLHTAPADVNEIVCFDRTSDGRLVYIAKVNAGSRLYVVSRGGQTQDITRRLEEHFESQYPVRDYLSISAGYDAEMGPKIWVSFTGGNPQASYFGWFDLDNLLGGVLGGGDFPWTATQEDLLTWHFQEQAGGPASFVYEDGIGRGPYRHQGQSPHTPSVAYFAPDQMYMVGTNLASDIIRITIQAPKTQTTWPQTSSSVIATGTFSFPRLSPDGQRIVAQSGANSIVLMRSDGSAPITLGQGTKPTWR